MKYGRTSRLSKMRPGEVGAIETPRNERRLIVCFDPSDERIADENGICVAGIDVSAQQPRLVHMDTAHNDYFPVRVFPDDVEFVPVEKTRSTFAHINTDGTGAIFLGSAGKLWWTNRTGTFFDLTSFKAQTNSPFENGTAFGFCGWRVERFYRNKVDPWWKFEYSEQIISP
ncbi:MAG: hypothetical protein JJ931_15505 [Henriciella sp.]|jgi:hypothetical protein|nr:hypothetical protein [Henriciella sp.]MBO6696812.1 hypothetical protein [Henriciella sp.]